MSTDETFKYDEFKKGKTKTETQWEIKEVAEQMLSDWREGCEIYYSNGKGETKMKFLDYDTNYIKLIEVFENAYLRSANGKGYERHANGEAFEKQKICEINRQLGTTDGMKYQAIKKILESNRLKSESKINELLDVINYIAAAIILEKEFLERDANR